MMPNKIYIGHDVYNNADKYWGENSNTDIPGKSYVEYIRKEALLEWLNQMLKFSAQSLEFQRNYAYGKVIDKLNEM